jgi:hypothetical protein
MVEGNKDCLSEKLPRGYKTQYEDGEDPHQASVYRLPVQLPVKIRNLPKKAAKENTGAKTSEA